MIVGVVEVFAGRRVLLADQLHARRAQGRELAFRRSLARAPHKVLMPAERYFAALRGSCSQTAIGKNEASWGGPCCHLA